MQIAEENSPKHSDADNYGFFMTALFGLIDDAELSGYSPDATALLCRARDLYWQEFSARHPGAWDASQRPEPQPGANGD